MIRVIALIPFVIFVWKKKISAKASSRGRRISRKRGVHNAICHAAAGNNAKEWDRREVGDRVSAEIDSRIFLCEAPFDNPRAVLWLPPAVTVTRNAWISTIPWCVYTQFSACIVGHGSEDRKSATNRPRRVSAIRENLPLSAPPQSPRDRPTRPVSFSPFCPRDNFSLRPPPPPPLSLRLAFYRPKLLTDDAFHRSRYARHKHLLLLESPRAYLPRDICEPIIIIYYKFKSDFFFNKRSINRRIRVYKRVYKSSPLSFFLSSHLPS